MNTTTAAELVAGSKVWDGTNLRTVESVVTSATTGTIRITWTGGDVQVCQPTKTFQAR